MIVKNLVHIYVHHACFILLIQSVLFLLLNLFYSFRLIFFHMRSRLQKHSKNPQRWGLRLHPLIIEENTAVRVDRVETYGLPVLLFCKICKTSFSAWFLHNVLYSGRSNRNI